MKHLRHLMVLCGWVTMATSCGDEEPEMHTVMEVMGHFQTHMTQVTQSVKEGNQADVDKNIEAFRGYLETESYQKFLVIMEPGAQVRYKHLAKRLHGLQSAMNGGATEVVKTSYRELRDTCMNCHFIARIGNKRAYLEKEIPNIE